MSENLLINCFPIRIKEDEATIYISDTEFNGSISSSKAKLTKKNDDYTCRMYWSPEYFTGVETQKISRETHRNLFRDYLNEELYKHFKGLGALCRKSFLGGTEVWVSDSERHEVNSFVHQAFTMRVLSPRDQYVTDGWTILLGYNGERTTHLRSCGGKEIPDELITTFIYENQIFQSNKWPEENLPRDIDALNNRGIANFLGQQVSFRKDSNKYLTNYNQISNFYKFQLKGKQLGNLIYVLESGMGQVFDSQLRKTSLRKNVLEFRESKTHFNAYMGLKEYGPVTGPKVSPYKLFFIFNENNRDHANKLFQYLNRGFKGYPGLKSFVDVDLNLDKANTITFANNEHPYQEIANKLSQMTLEEGVTYHAIYISPINRDDPDDDKRTEYFLVKEALLSRNINSQVIFLGNIDEPNFNFFLPNISIAILAKLGGKPWRLNREVKNELIIGIGAYRQEEEKYLGTTFTFRNDGTFVGFDAMHCTAADELSSFFESTIKHFISYSDEKISSVKRVVIHFYKKMNKDEEKQLTDALERLDLQVPYFVLNITGVKTYDYLVFDDTFSGKMPQSGTCIKIRNGEYLLCNNTRYKERTGARIEDYPFPLKISISRSNPGSLNEEAIGDLIDQVYQFSRMYWRSVKQKAMPVTILYSEIIAKMAANLPNRAVPETTVARQTLWFL